MVSTNINEDIDRINEALDIVDLIRNSPKVLNFQGSGDRYTAHTNRNSQSGASLIITPSENKWHDKATGEGGLPFNWIAYELIGNSRPRGRDVREVLYVAAERAGITLSEHSEEDKALYDEKEEIIKLFEEVNAVWVENLQNTPEILEDLQKRHGLTAEQAREHGIGYTVGNQDLKSFDDDLLIKSGLVYSKDGKRGTAFFQHRITYPYIKNSKPVYFAGRLTANTPKWDRGENDRNKYKKLQTYSEKHPQVSKAIRNNTIYGQDTVRGKPYFIITEGIGDCLALHCAGLPAISPITTAFPKNDIPKLLDLSAGKEKVYIINDSEESGSGEAGALKTARILEAEGITAIIVILPRDEEVKKVDVAEFLRDNSKEALLNVMDSDCAFGLWDYILSKKEVKASTKIIERIRDFKAFIEKDLSEMNPAEWEPFVNNNVREKFGLAAKDIKTTVKEVSSRRKANLNNSEGDEENPRRGTGRQQHRRLSRLGSSAGESHFRQ